MAICNKLKINYLQVYTEEKAVKITLLIKKY